MTGSPCGCLHAVGRIYWCLERAADTLSPEQCSMIDSEARTSLPDQAECWPSLPLASWEKTRDTLHMWTQIVGKVRMGLTPKINHWWNVPLYVSARGLTTSPIPYGRDAFEVEFDFIDHK